MKKRIISLFLAFVMCVMPFSVCFANDAKKDTIDWNGGTVGLPTGADTVAVNAFAAIKAVAMIVAVFIIVFFGIKYLTAGAGEKAKTKEMMVPFLIGAALIMLAPNIAEWIWTFGSSAS